MKQLSLCRPPKPSGPPPVPTNWYDVLHGPCLCGHNKKPQHAFCASCSERLEPVLIRHLNRARSNRAFLFWWRFSAARLASQGRTLHLLRGHQ